MPSVRALGKVAPDGAVQVRVRSQHRMNTTYVASPANTATDTDDATHGDNATQGEDAMHGDDATHAPEGPPTRARARAWRPTLPWPTAAQSRQPPLPLLSSRGASPLLSFAPPPRRSPTALASPAPPALLRRCCPRAVGERRRRAVRESRWCVRWSLGCGRAGRGHCS